MFELQEVNGLSGVVCWEAVGDGSEAEVWALAEEFEEDIGGVVGEAAVAVLGVDEGEEEVGGGGEEVG